MPTEERFTVKFGMPCPDCAGEVFADPEGFEAQCSECREKFDIKEEAEARPHPPKEEEPQNFLDDMEGFDPDELESDADEVIDADFEVEETDEQQRRLPILDTVREQLEADYNETLSKIEQDVEKQVESVMGVMITRLSEEVIKQVAADLMTRVSEKQAEKAKMENLFFPGTREAAIMGELLLGPKTLDEIRLGIPVARGKAPSDKTIKTWILGLDSLRDYKVTEDESEDTFRLERR